MSHWFVSRHPGAIAWMRAQPIAIDRWVSHLEIAQVEAGDRVYGTLPVPLAAEICARGAEYIHLELVLPEALRGRELTQDEMRTLGASLQAYEVAPVSKLNQTSGDAFRTGCKIEETP